MTVSSRLAFSAVLHGCVWVCGGGMQEGVIFKSFHRWFGRLLLLWAYFCAWTGG